MIQMKNNDIIFSLLRAALMGKPLELSLFEGMSRGEWKEVYLMARQQGVLAVCFDGVKALPDRKSVV